MSQIQQPSNGVPQQEPQVSIPWYVDADGLCRPLL